MAEKASSCGVEVLTWGSGMSNGNGMLQFADTILFGGNTGHAALRLTIPADEEGRRLIDTYCKGPPEIPYQLKQIQTPDANDRDNPAYEESVYEVYFSWWPGEQEGEEESLHDHDHDRQSEAIGVDVKYNQHWEGAKDASQRKIAGRLGERVITMGIDRTVQLTQVSDEEMKQVQLNEQRAQLINKLDSIGLFSSKLEELSDKSENDTIPMTTTLNILINRHAKEWKKNLKPEDVVFRKDGTTIASISKESLKDLQFELEQKSQKIESKIDTINSSIDEDLLTKLVDEGRMKINLGANPDDIISLPITTADKPNDPKRLSPEKMLQQMRSIIKKGGFDIISNNCSGTVDSVLAAGCNDIKLKQSFKEGAFNHFKNPQEAYLHAKHFQQELYRTKPKGILNRVGDAVKKGNPLKLARNQLLKAMASPDSGPVKIALVVTGLAGVGFISAPFFLMKKMANPAQTIKDVDRFSEYTAKRNSRFFKALAAMASGPAHLILGVPAMVQNGVGSILSSRGLEQSKNKQKSLEAKERQIEIEELRKMNPPDREKRVDDKMLSVMYNELLQEKIKDKSHVISEKDPRVALAKFHEILKNQADVIPVFDKQTSKSVADFINKTKDQSIVRQFNEDSKTAVGRLKAVEKNIQEGEEQLSAEGIKRFESKSAKLLNDIEGTEPSAKSKGSQESLFDGQRVPLEEAAPPLPAKTNAGNPPPLPAKTNAGNPPPLPAKTNAGNPPPLPAKTNAGNPPPLPAKTNAGNPPPLPAKANAGNPPPLPAKPSDGNPPPLPAKPSADNNPPPLPMKPNGENPPPLPAKLRASSDGATPSARFEDVPALPPKPADHSSILSQKSNAFMPGYLEMSKHVGTKNKGADNESQVPKLPPTKLR
jgi:hypothetical protein